MYRDRKLLDLAHGMSCMADFPHVCNGASVPAHSNEQMYGRGMGNKAHDCFFAAVCPEAHDWIDGRKGKWSKEDKHYVWLRAHIRTMIELFSARLVGVINGRNQ